MNFMNKLVISKEIETILLSKFCNLFLELFTKFGEDINFYLEYINRPNSFNILTKSHKDTLEGKFKFWYLLNQTIFKEVKSVPLIVYNYCSNRAKEAYLEVKKFSKKYNIDLDFVYKQFKKICSKFIYYTNNKYNTNSNISPQALRYSLDKKLTLSSNPTSKSATGINQNILNIQERNQYTQFPTITTVNEKNNNQNRAEDNKKEVNNYITNWVNSKSKLNIYVGEYETYSCKNPVHLEKVNIYNGMLCSSYYVNSNFKKKNYEIGVGERVDIKKIISNEGGVFIPSNVNKDRQKEFFQNRVSDEIPQTNSRSNTSGLLDKIRLRKHSNSNESNKKNIISNQTESPFISCKSIYRVKSFSNKTIKSNSGFSTSSPSKYSSHFSGDNSKNENNIYKSRNNLRLNTNHFPDSATEYHNRKTSKNNFSSNVITVTNGNNLNSNKLTKTNLSFSPKKQKSIYKLDYKYGITVSNKKPHKIVHLIRSDKATKQKKKFISRYNSSNYLDKNDFYFNN